MRHARMIAIAAGILSMVSCKDEDDKSCQEAVEACDDGRDNDCDGLIDCADSNDCACTRTFETQVVLGEGGFFGVSGRPIVPPNGSTPGYFAVGAHYAAMPDGAGGSIATGRVYLFTMNAVPTSITEAVAVLEPLDQASGGGFGYSISNPCDLNGDGFWDLPVGNHLYSSPTLNNCGRAVVFWGSSNGPVSFVSPTYHTLSSGRAVNSDVLGQTVLCADFNGDGFDDLLATGQNAGPHDSGMGAIFYGSAAGISANENAVIEPAVAASRQYFGAASLYEDVNGDGLRDLVIGGWGMIKGDLTTGPHTGGVQIFAGGSDWTLGPAYRLSPDGDRQINMGMTMVFADTGTTKYLVISASDYGSPVTGAVFVYTVGVPDFAARPPIDVLVPPAGNEDVGFGVAVEYVPDFNGKNGGALLVGMDTATAGNGEDYAGAVAVYPLAPDGSGFAPDATILSAPVPVAGDSFGCSIVALDDLDNDGLRDFFVGMLGHVEGEIYVDPQLGGIIVFH